MIDKARRYGDCNPGSAAGGIMKGSQKDRPPAPDLLRVLLDEAAHACDRAEGGAALQPHELIGLMCGRMIEVTASAQRATGVHLGIQACAELLGGIASPRGGSFSLGPVSDGCIRLITRHCPFTDGATDAPQLCQVAIGAIGTLAARNLGYAKVELRQRMTESDRCEIWIHTDPKEAAAHSGIAYRRNGNGILVEAAAPDHAKRIALRPSSCPQAAAPVAKGVAAIVARSEVMRPVLRAIETVAPARTTVLVTGETGVGKELVARHLHALSPRAQHPFVAINCGAIPENLIESALFGHEKGAFTGAHERHSGVFERAEGGTLFLDEIDCLPLSAQTRLLRVLQECEFERVGAHRAIPSNVRVIVACNSDLEERVAQGRFRRDLYYRINVVGIAIPPLRERREDIPPLIEHILANIRRKHGTQVREISLGGMAELIAYDWPGNVRELENVLERSCLFCTGTRLTRVDLGRMIGEPQDAAGTNPAVSSLRDHRRRALDELERNLFREEMRKARGSVPAVARRMGVTSRAVYLKLKRHGIDPASFRN